MTTARTQNVDGKVMMNCSIWTISSDPGKAWIGRIEIDSVNKRLCVFDDDTYPPDLFPITFAVHDIALNGAGVHIRINPVRSTNNNFQLGKIQVSYTGGVYFTFFVSMADCRTVIGIVNGW